jgi:hypothetical protein
MVDNLSAFIYECTHIPELKGATFINGVAFPNGGMDIFPL